MPIEEPDIGIDKQKVVREIPQEDTSKTADSGAVAEQEEEKEKGPGFWKSVWQNSDQIGSLLILLAGVVWILAGLLLLHPIPMAIGGIVLIPGVIGMSGFFKKAES